MALVCSMFIISQVVVFNIDDVRNLWKGSALLGLAYGGLFGLFPTLVIEWFGLGEFGSERITVHRIYDINHRSQHTFRRIGVSSRYHRS